VARMGEVWPGRRGLAGHGLDWRGVARQARLGVARFGLAGRGPAWQA